MTPTTMARLIGCAFVLLLIAACDSDRRVPIPLPKLPDGPVELRVIYLVNPRFASPSAEELRAVLDSAAATVKAHFGRDVRFMEPEVAPIDTYFRKIDAEARALLAPWIYDFKHGKGDLRRLRKGFENDLRRSGDDLDAMIAYSAPHLSKPVAGRSYEALVDALVTTQLSRVDALKNERAADGQLVLDAQPYNEYIYWDVMADFPLPYEVVLTNQLIASVEYTGNEIHSALRGGVSNGLTTPNAGSRYKSTAIVSTYPFTSDDPAIKALRAGESYARPDALRFAGVLLAHEIGHQLWHLGHPYGRPACIMNPAPLLHFRQWVQALAPAECPFAKEGAMQPGFVPFTLLDPPGVRHRTTVWKNRAAEKH